MEDAKEKAEEHWVWLERLLHLLFVDAFVHGWKHAKQDEEASNE